MLIRWNGPATVQRVVGEYTFSKNGRVCDVTKPDLIERLISDPDFCIDANEPLLQVTGDGDVLGLMALEGVASVGDLIELDKTAVKKLARGLGITQTAVRKMIKAAKSSDVDTAVFTAVVEDDCGCGQ